MKQFLKLSKLNNKGVTLIELLVAFVIIGIIIGPFMHTFVTTTMVNSKSKQQEEATTAAVNVMEQIRGTNLAELMGYERYVLDGSGNPVLDASGNKLKNPVSEEDFLKSKQTDISTVVPTATMDGYTTEFEQTVNGKDYVVKAYFDPSYDTSVSNSDEYTDYNAEKFANIYAMSKSQDGYFLVNETMDDSAVSMFGGNAIDVINGMKRTITVDIKKSGSSTTVTAKVSYDYNGKTKIVSDTKPVYTNNDPNVDLRNIYLFFNPMYRGKDREKIIIKNHDKVPVALYLVRESDESVVKKSNYDVEVELHETGRTDFDSKVTVLRTNLINEGTIKQLKVKYMSATKSDSEIKEFLDIRDLSASKEAERALNVMLNVYSKDKDGNEKLLFTYTGTKEN